MKILIKKRSSTPYKKVQQIFLAIYFEAILSPRMRERDREREREREYEKERGREREIYRGREGE